MKTMSKNRASKVLTAAYLISAGVISIATSKAPDGSYGGVSTTQANYSVQSNCNSAASKSVDAFHVFNGRIASTLDDDGVVRSTTIADFRDLGFPQPAVVVGVDVVNGARKCAVRSKLKQSNTHPSADDTQYSFIEIGYLTTVNYDCYTEMNSYQCSISLKELPAGDLQAVF